MKAVLVEPVKKSKECPYVAGVFCNREEMPPRCSLCPIYGKSKWRVDADAKRNTKN